MIDELLFDSSDEDEEIQQPRRRKHFRQRINFDFLSEIEYKERFRMNSGKVEFILRRIGHELEYASTKGGSLSPKQQLSIALHWMGSGSQYHTIADMHGVHKSSVCRAILRVVQAVNSHLLRDVVKWPENIENEVEKFFQIANFPYVCGVVDGSLIPIQAPSQYEAAFVDRKGQHSLNCMFVCGATCQFFYVNSNWPGSLHDSRVLRSSQLYQRMEGGLFRNFVLLGDSGFPLRTWLMTPLHANPNDPAERRYNRRLKSTRRIIECALGILKEKFPCLNYLRVDPVHASNIIKCCTALCNIAREDVDEEQLNWNEIIDDDIEDPINEQHPLDAQMRQMEIINLMN